MQYYVYAIKSEISDRIYIGQTQDLTGRLQKHNTGKVISTKNDRPWILYAYEMFNDRSLSMWAEKEIKKSRGKRIKWLENNLLK
ncbi:MAG: GIY-YIG nuclease family protein [Desulfohalobiaceae bacterium]|nr:GIY-YIG nuclease family protein [Desulfohalobiaceae bacterium]